MSSSWRKVENENGFPFYVNETDNSRQWDHPKYSDIKQRIDDCNYIKYASYRVASKFRVLQHALFMNDVPLSIVSGVFEKHRLGATESSLCLESYDLEAILSDIYFAANKHSHTNTDVDVATELTMNFLYNVYDTDRKSNIEVSSAKATLALLSNAKLPELYKFIFSLCADHNNCVTRLRLQSLLSKISAITVYLNENAYYGHHSVPASVEHCFNNSPGLVGVSESAFILWLEHVPQLFSWLPVLHRLKSSETVLYHGKCSVCKLSPLMGLRYKCVKCRNYVQCQRCFLMGRLSRSHKLSHAMREHYGESSRSWGFNYIAERLCDLLKCTNGSGDGCIMDVNIIDGKFLNKNKELLLKPSQNEDACNVQPLSSPLSQLQVIIKQLELQNRELQQMLMLGIRGDKEMKRCLEEHRIHVEAQIEKLKMLKDYMNNDNNTKRNRFPDIHLLESTPMVCNGRPSSALLTGIELFSPIAQPQANITVDKLNPPIFNLDKSTKERDAFPDSVTAQYSLQDISTWIGGQPASSKNYHSNFEDGLKLQNPPIQTDLDDALAKLQQILANNFSLDESLGNLDNCHLKNAVTEVEGMLSSIIDNVEITKNSTPPTNPIKDIDYLIESTSGYVTGNS